VRIIAESPRLYFLPFLSRNLLRTLSEP
jgi:hypothetical protein